MRFHNFWSYRSILLSGGFLKSVLSSRRNLIAAGDDRPLPAGPYMAELDVTYQCNLRCRMCQRWLDPRRDELTCEEYERLAREFAEMGVHQISIAGGEPLLRPDVFDIIRGFASRGMSVNLCTNGMHLERYRNEIAASGATCVTVSIDGADAECHDRIRGRAGSYRQIVDGVHALLAARANGSPLVRVRMTVSEDNAGQLRRFYDQWREAADDVLFQPVHHCSDSYYTGVDTAATAAAADRLRTQIQGTRMQRDPYMQRWAGSMASGEPFPLEECHAGVLMARIDPWGNVYPCLEQHVCVGSVRGSSFAAVWASEAFEQERRRLASGRACRCWYNNTAVIGHFGALLGRTIPNRKRSLRETTASAATTTFPGR
jgi:MoaA/NifB/PqqE/SkfB family radical SAM enzyme